MKHHTEYTHGKHVSARVKKSSDQPLISQYAIKRKHDDEQDEKHFNIKARRKIGFRTKIRSHFGRS